MQTWEGELRCFHTDPVNIKSRFIRTRVWSVKHDAGSRFDKVTFQYFRYERETTRSTQVTFNYFHLVITSQELDVERTGDIEFLSNLTADLLDAAGSCKVYLLCREHQCSITGVNTRKFYVFRDSIFYHLTVLCHSVELNFFCILEELWNNYRIFFRYFGSHFQEVFQFFIIIANIHCRTRKNVRRTNQHRITYFFHKAFHIFETGQLLPSRLVDTQLVKHCRELVTVFGTVDRDRRSTQYRNRLTIKFHSQVVRNLSAYRHNHTARLFEIDHIEHTFERKFVEVQAVAHIIVSRNRFRVVVNHDRLVSQFAGSLNRIHRTPVKFNRATDTVSTRAQHDYWFFILIIVHIITFHCIRHIQIVSQFRMFGSNRIDAFYCRKNPHSFTMSTYSQVFFLHVSSRVQYETCNLEVREA